MTALSLRGVSKSFGAARVVSDVDLDVAEGELIVFVGPSGCGKSTLLRVIAGLEEATAGEVVIGGQDVTGLPPAERGIAMVFQSYALYPHLDARGNMALALRQARMPRARIEARVAEAARMLELGPLLDRKPAELSGGQRQRVAIGRAVVREPRLMLLDEPLSNLDASLRAATRLEIAALHRELGATMIYVTHDQVEAMTLADRIVVLREGRVEQVGAPLELYNAPANRFVAGFLGTPPMNLLPAPLLGGPKGHLAGIRPERLALAPPDGPLAGAVRHVERLGGDTNVIVGLDAGPEVTARLFGQHDVREGARLGLSFDPAHRLLFGPDERRVAGRGAASRK